MPMMILRMLVIMKTRRQAETEGMGKGSRDCAGQRKELEGVAYTGTTITIDDDKRERHKRPRDAEYSRTSVTLSRLLCQGV